jgi:hypothetical protein
MTQTLKITLCVIQNRNYFEIEKPWKTKLFPVISMLIVAEASLESVRLTDLKAIGSSLLRIIKIFH